ncbi:hypothetical protein Ancab_032722, partial [Ancistrocladus abbreviatus]
MATFWIDSGNFLCLLSSSDSLNLLTLFSINKPALDGFTVLIPHISTMSYTAGKLKGVLIESGSPEEICLLYGWKEGGGKECEFHKEIKEFQLLPKLARAQPFVVNAKLQTLEVTCKSLELKLQL